MNKLELKHIQHYPMGIDGVKVRYFDDEREQWHTCSITELREDECTISSSENSYEVNFDEFKLLLHDLSDLTKPIIVPGYNEGKEFVPFSHWYPTYPDFKYYEQIGHDFIMRLGNVKAQFPMELSLSDWKLLYQWHFAINMPEGSWIDINTL